MDVSLSPSVSFPGFSVSRFFFSAVLPLLLRWLTEPAFLFLECLSGQSGLFLFGLTFFDLSDGVFDRLVSPGDEFFGFLLSLLDDCFPEFGSIIQLFL